MSNSVYSINKGINKPVEFKGLKAQYIWYLVGGIIGLLVLFAILYICGVNTLICLGLVVILCGLLFGYVYHLSRTYGEYGLMKKMARKRMPRHIRCYHRNFYQSSSKIN